MKLTPFVQTLNVFLGKMVVYFKACCSHRFVHFFFNVFHISKDFKRVIKGFNLALVYYFDQRCSLPRRVQPVNLLSTRSVRSNNGFVQKLCFYDITLTRNLDIQDQPSTVCNVFSMKL